MHRYHLEADKCGKAGFFQSKQSKQSKPAAGYGFMGIRTDVDIKVTAVTHEGKPEHNKMNPTAVTADAHIQLFIKILTRR